VEREWQPKFALPAIASIPPPPSSASAATTSKTPNNASSPGRERPVEQWHENPFVAASFLLICSPAGIILTWRNRRLTWNQKALLICAWFVLFAIAMYLRAKRMAMSQWET